MIKSNLKKMGKTIYLLYPGDYHATGEDCIISTVTGSCVAVCLYDPLLRIGGMGHFIVPGGIGTDEIYKDQIASHGITSMEYLIGEMVKLGGDRKRFVAKIFGASYINDVDTKMHGISLSVVKFLNSYFTYEKIPVESDDLGGNYRRKVYFFPGTGKAFRKILVSNEDSSEFIRLETEYINEAFSNRNSYGKIVLFE